MPLRPLRNASQKEAGPCPSGVMTPIPVSTTRRALEGMTHLRLSALCRDLGQAKHVFQFAAEDEVALAEHLLRARLVEVREKDLRLAERVLQHIGDRRSGPDRVDLAA